MEIMSDCSNAGSVEMATSVKVGRVLAYIAAFGLMLVAFCIMLAFGGPVYVEPNFQNTANLIKGFAVICLFGGGRIVVLLATGFQKNQDIRVLKSLSAIGMALGIVMIAMGAWGNFTS